VKSYHSNLGAGIDGLVVREHDAPEPGSGQVLVRVRASSLSYRELMILRGWYPLPIRPDVVPISDGAGEVAALGAGVSRDFAVGDRVSAAIFPRWIDGRFGLDVADQLGGSLDGMLTEYALLDADALVRIPDHLSYEQAATLPCAAVTAWHALTGGRGLQATARKREVAFVGMLSDGDTGLPPLDPRVLWMSGADVRTIAVGTRAHFEALNRAIRVHAIKPVIDRVFAFAEAVEAYRYYETSKPFGKVVIAHP
jgi:NADPH:quinone reductase-like Zn-dependent oxidoreductase